MSKPKFLVLGGCGFIGRNVVLHLVKNDVAESIVVADKSRPELSWFTRDHKELFNNDKVVFKQCNLVNKTAVEGLFQNQSFDYIINCCLEARLGMTQEVYTESVVKVGINIATIAAQVKIKKFVQLSSGSVYLCKKGPAVEDSNEDPGTLQAIAHLQLDKELKNIKDLNYVIVRPAIIYGPGDHYSLTPRYIIASVYHLLGEKMRLLYTKDLEMNTVHVRDVAHAMVFLCSHETKNSIYILCDKSSTSQGSLNDMLASIFKINYEYVGAVETNMAKAMLKRVAKDLNEKHMLPWSNACGKEEINMTPLSPYLDKEALKYSQVNLDGSAIEKIGFKYEFPTISIELIREVVDDFVENKLFPKLGYPSQ